MSKYEIFAKKRNMIITNVVRVLLIFLFLRSFVIKDHSQDLVILLTFFLTYYPSILAKKFGVYLPSKLELIITLFIFAAQVLGEIGDFYNKFSWWDLMLHTTSGTILGWLGFLFVYLLNSTGSLKNVKF